MQLNPSEISNLIQQRIGDLQVETQARTEGTIVSLSDGIVRVHGLGEVMQGEMLELPGNTFGMALNLERDSVGVVVLGGYQHLSEGDTVRCTGRILEVPVGPELLGRVVKPSVNRLMAKAMSAVVKPPQLKKLLQVLSAVSQLTSLCRLALNQSTPWCRLVVVSAN